LNKPFSRRSREVVKTRYEIMGATSLARKEHDTHEQQASQLRPVRTAAQLRRPSGLLDLDAQLLLRRREQLREESEEEGEEMSYRVRNHTDLPLKEVRQLISFAGADLDFDRGVIWVNVRWTKPHKDRSNPYPASGWCDWPVHMNVSIAKPDAYPLPWLDRAYVGLELGMIRSWQESLVAIAAHELKHLAEFQRGCTSRQKLMEGRCDAYAYSRLTAHREKVAT
jgi:hypothetical protein